MCYDPYIKIHKTEQVSSLLIIGVIAIIALLLMILVLSLVFYF